MAEPGNSTILVLEHDASLRNALERLLHRYGWSVAAAGNLRDALRLLAEQRSLIRLALVDVSSGEPSGMSLVRHLGRRHADLAVLAFASGEDWSAYGEAQALGVREVLIKPAAPDAIVGAVRRALGEAGAASERPSAHRP